MTTGIDVSWNYFTDTGLRAICDAIRNRARLDLPVTVDDDVEEDDLMMEQHLFKYAIDLSFCGSVTPSALIAAASNLAGSAHVHDDSDDHDSDFYDPDNDSRDFHDYGN